MLDFSSCKTDCTGCALCMSVCPRKCITMEEDLEGFQYPSANLNCIHCGKCEAVCPQKNRPYIDGQIKKRAFAAVTKKHSVWERSASGGAFSEISRIWGEGKKNSIFVGAKWNGFKVEEVCVEGYDRILPICRSKYIASNNGDIYSQIKSYVLEGRRVLFCGTPCQIAGLRKYLNCDYENLLCIDLICHGIGSPIAFASCVEAIEEQLNLSISNYEFRAKRKVHEIDYLSKITTKSGKSIYLIKDQYTQLFLKQSILRPSCVGHCKYRNMNRMGDITIADLKGKTHIFPKRVGEKYNYSTIVFNTIKGERIIDELNRSMMMIPIQIDEIIKYNPLFAHDTKITSDRDAFFAEYILNPKLAISKYTKPAIIYKTGIFKNIYNILPVFVRAKMIRLRGLLNGKK